MKSMMRTTTALLPSGAPASSLLRLALLTAVLGPCLAQAQTACNLPRGTTIFGLTPDNRVVEYVVTANPAGPTNVVGSVVTRVANGLLLDIDKSVVGIDFRPADSNEANLYTLTDQGDVRVFSPYSGAISASAQLLTGPVSNLTVPFQGGLHTTMDFNPVLDAIRLVGSNDQNFAIVNSAGGNLNAFAQQTALRYAAGDVAAGVDPNITTGAYDNNFAGSTRTTFYMLDYARNTLVTIADRNAAGSSNTGGGMLKTIGNLVEPNGTPINVSAGSGLDIVTTPDGRNVAVGHTARRLFCVDLATVNADAPLGVTQNVTVFPIQRNAFVNNGFLPVNERLIDVAVPIRAPVSADAVATVTRKGSTSTVARLGDSVAFSVTVRNDGPSISAGLSVNIRANQSNVGTLEIAQSFLSGGASCSRSAIFGMEGQVTCSLPALRSGAEVTMSFDATTIRPASQPGTVTLTTQAVVSTEVSDPNTANNTSTRVISLTF